MGFQAKIDIQEMEQNIAMIYKWIANNFPALGLYKRLITALLSAVMPTRKTYSQYGEDVFILETLEKYNTEGSIYVDVGANHPTQISNTYLLYRNGFRGVVIEPNPELINLFNRFRKRDSAIMIGCSDVPSLLPFNISRTPVMSSFIDDRNSNAYKTIYVPVLPLDIALHNMQFDYINLLSIDVEGLNLQVLSGAKVVVHKALIVCIEYDSEMEKNELSKLLGDCFQLIGEFGCNLIYLNKELADRHSKEEEVR